MPLDHSSHDVAVCLGLKNNTFKLMISNALTMKLLDDNVEGKTTVGIHPSMMPALQGWIQATTVVSYFDRLEDDESDLVFSDISHLYLPALWEAHQLAVKHAFNNPWTKFLFLLGIRPTLPFDRFARRPQEGAALLDSFYIVNIFFLDSITKKLEKKVLSPPSLPSDEIPEHLIYRIASNRIIFHLTILRDRASGPVPTPNITPSSNLFLASLEPLLKLTESRDGERYRLADQEATQFLAYSADLMDLMAGRGSARDWEKVKSDTPWNRCERRGKQGIVGDCVKMGGGKEMMACGRCNLVRYCSREHQRSDWKEHKKTCLEPVW